MTPRRSTAFISAAAVAPLPTTASAAPLPPPPPPPPPPRAVSRRTLIRAIPLLPLPLLLHPPQCARAAASRQVSQQLVSLVRLRDSLTQLSDHVENGTNADVRRVVRTLLRSCDVPSAVSTVVKPAPPSSREQAVLAGRDAFEYLNQVVEYFDATATRQRPSAKELAFLLQCIVTAADRLDVVLGVVDGGDVELARQLVVAPVRTDAR